MPKVTKEMVIAVVIIGFLVTVAYGAEIMEFVTGLDDDDDDDEVDLSKFVFSAVKKDATGTSVTGATARAWYDADGDSTIDWATEIGDFTESSGIYTSNREDYPIGISHDIWVQIYATNYQTTYQLVHMTGVRNTDGSAKSVSNIEMILTDDSLTYDGLIRNTAWDDSTDYNYTLNGAEGIAKVVINLATQYSGLSSQLWEGVDYMSIYDLQKTAGDYWLKWAEVSASTGIMKSNLYAPTFLGMYFTEQDAVDGQISSADFDGHYYGPSNRYFWSVDGIVWDDLFYYGTDDVAPEPEFAFNINCKAAGAAIYLGFWQNLDYEDMVDGIWGTAGANVIGTHGADWDWVA